MKVVPVRLTNQKFGLVVGAFGGALLTVAVIGLLVAFGSRDSKRATPAHPATLHTLRWGETVLDPRTGTRCKASGEAGIPNLVCIHVPHGVHQAVFWDDDLQVYGPGSQPMEPTYSFRWWARPR
jgi:hypothetical protein